MEIVSLEFNRMLERLREREEKRKEMISSQIRKGCDKCSQWDDYWGCDKCERG